MFSRALPFLSARSSPPPRARCPGIDTTGRVSFDERPGKRAEDRIAETDEPGLGPVQVRVGGLFAEEAEGMHGIVRGPFVLERLDRPVPYQAVRKLLAKCHQLALEIGLTNLKGGFQVDIVGSDRVVPVIPGTPSVIPGLTGNLTSSCHRSHDRRTAPEYTRTPQRFLQ